MNIELVGTGSIGAIQTSASTLIDNKMLIDLPNGIIKRLKQTNHDILNIETCLITHLHADHFFDIPFFMLERYFNKTENIAKIICPKNTKMKVKQLFDIGFPGNWEKVSKLAKVEFIEFENLNKEKIDNNIYVTSKLVEHGKLKPAYGFIINIQGHTIGVSGDSRICESIFEIVDKSEISILDMSAIDMKTNAHMNLYDIKELCYKYKNKTIIATHMHDYTREKAKEEKIDNLIIPEDGQIIKV